MTKRNLAKRILPFLLSLAMAFQSVPMTALAEEDPQTVPLAEKTDTPTEPTANPTEDSGDSKADEGTSADSEAEDFTDQTGTDSGENIGEESEPGAQAAVISTEITVSDEKNYGNFERVQSEGRLTYTMPYDENGNIGDVITAVKEKTTIMVNGEEVNSLKENYLVIEWREVKDGAVASAGMAGTPQNAGSYALHLETREQEGVCGKAEYTLYFNITSKKLTLNHLRTVLSEVKSGSKVADLKDKAADCKLKDGEIDFTALQYTIAVKVYKAGEETETTDTVLHKNTDYIVKAEVTFADTEAAKNYEAPDKEQEYPVYFATNLAQTSVEVKRPDKEMIKTYAAGQSYTASAIAAEYGVTAEVVIKDSTEESLGADKAVAKWYKKEIKDTAISGFPGNSEDNITQFLWNDALYTLMADDSAAGESAEAAEVKVEEVGDYYLVYVYEGEEGLYAASHGEPLKFTIDPIFVTLRPTEIGELNTGMTKAGLRKALAEAGSKLYNTDVNPAVLSDAPVNGDPEHHKDFYGVSYDDDTVTQYYSPVFELVRFKKAKKAEDVNWPAEWSENYETINVWNRNDDGNQLAGIELGDGKTIDYDYYIRFTGEKAVFLANGSIMHRRPITEATDAANRNYEVKTDDETLTNKENMFRVEIKDVTETGIDVTEIIKAFQAEGGRGKGGAGLGAEDPAWTIYDMDAALFADRAAYKKAIVTGTEIKDTDKDITYTWEKSSCTVENYYDFTRELAAMEKAEGETDEEFIARKENRIERFQENDYRWLAQSVIPQDAGLYRLHITYQDSALVSTNAPAEGAAYFLIKKQELVFVADTQYAQYDDSVLNFLPKGTAYSVYLLPNNDESSLDLEKPLGWQTGYVHWNAMNQKKDAAGVNIPGEWAEASGVFKNTNDYVYKAAVWLDSALPDTTVILDTDGQTVKNEAGASLKWGNYTTENTAVWDEKTGEYKQHIKVGEGFGDIQFGAGAIQFVVDRSKLVDKTYDGIRSVGLPEGLVKLTDKNGADIPAEKLQINGEPQEGTGVAEVAWKWLDFDGNNVGANNAERIVRADEVRFGGVYRLVARFDGYCNTDGTAEYAPYDPDKTGNSGWVELTDADGKPYDWTISPLKITMAPDVKPEVTAGEQLGEMAENWHVIAAPVNGEEKIPDGTAENQEDDEWLFEKAEDGGVWNAVTDKEIACSGGYPILGGGTNDFTKEYYEDNVKVRPFAKQRVRFGKKYDIKLTKRDLWAQYQYSYDVTMKAAGPTAIHRGDVNVEGAKFFDKNSSGSATAREESCVSVHTEKDENGIYQIQPREGIPFVYKDYRLMAEGANGWDSSAVLWRLTPTDLITGKKIELDKNYIAVNIVSPLEFSAEFSGGLEDNSPFHQNNYTFARDNFVYENSIREAGGYVLSVFGRPDPDNAGVDGIRRFFITAIFPVELGDDGKIKEIPAFNVTWETGYTDTFHFDLSNAKLEADLKKAVAPKSIAFNGVLSKMAVGEEQQLDVKMTKVQLDDVVRINYRLKGGETPTSNEYASINPETGLLTALATNNKKPVRVDIEAYPVRLAADGKTYEEISGKGVKIAKTKITITEVTAPVIKKVISQDTKAEVQFTKVDNGYRGEIYVKQFSNKKEAGRFKAADFETAIKDMKNGQWQDAFAVKPMYFSGDRNYVEKLKLCRQYVTGLEKGFYAIYVRNVSAVRTLADGTKTTESAAGNAKAFETTKSQVQNLYPYFEVLDEKTKANPVRYADEAQKGNKENHQRASYTVELADKSAQLTVDGRFYEKPSNEAAEAADSLWLRLSLKIAEKLDGVSKNYYTNTYLDPKLIYYVTDGEAPVFDPDTRKLKNPSKFVTINNRGKLTFKGVGQNGDLTVRVYAAVSDSYNDSSRNYAKENYCTLTITARPDTITTKKTKPMKVGDAIRLRDYIEYKQSRAKVTGYWSTKIEITNQTDVEEAGYEIYRVKADGETHPSIDGKLYKDEYIIIARKSDARALDLLFADWVWTAGSGGSQTPERVKAEGNKIALKPAQMDSVKGLKTVYTDDQAITINFTHPGHPEAFDIEVKDARGGVVYKRLVYRDKAHMAVVPADLSVWFPNTGVPKWLPNALTNLQRANLSRVNLRNINNNLLNRDFVYFEKTRTYAYTVNTNQLMRLSSYTLSVTPVYKGERAAKSVSTKAKTTNIPASYANGDVVNPEQTFQGVDLIFNGESSNTTFWTYLTSGNTYTMWTGADDGLAHRRGTDTLTWKSSNAKVASVKANQGSFTATLKALQQGKTTITVTSKVTKKTIARYHIAVKAVGKANSYGGDYENGGNGFYDKFIITIDPYYEGRTEVLTVSNSVTVTDEDNLSDVGTRDRTWVKFTAPSYGEYTFSCTKNYKIYYSSGSEAGDRMNGEVKEKTLRLEKGQEIYFRVRTQELSPHGFTLKVSGWSDFAKLESSYTEEKPLRVKKEAWISFTASEENVYTFHGSKTLSFEQNGQSADVKEEGFANGIYSYHKSMKAGEPIFIKVPADGSLWVTKREFMQTALTAGGSVNLSITRDNKDTVQYVKFTAAATGEYTFTYSPNSRIETAFTLQDGSSIYDGGTVVSEEIAKARTLDAGEEPAPALDEGAVRLFIQAGESIVIEINAKASELDAIIDDASKIDVIVKAAVPIAETALAVGEQTVTKATTQMFYFVIPDDTAATQYSLTAPGAEIKWYYGRTAKDVDDIVFGGRKLANLTAIGTHGNSFTVKDGGVIEPELTGKKSLHAGDKIYIEVTAKTEDSKVTLSKTTADTTFNEQTPASVVLKTAEDAEWRTFTVKKAGYYEFGKKITAVPAESAAHPVEVKLVARAFDESDRSIEGDTLILSGEASVVRKLDAGDYVFLIKATGAAAEGVTTTVALSVKEIVPEVLAKGDKPVSVPKGETKYYAFTKATSDEYTIKWVPGTDVGTPSVEYKTGNLGGDYDASAGGEINVSASDYQTYFIKVTADSDKDLSGTLQVAVKEKKFLKSGEEKTITFTKSGFEDYIFTTPEANGLGYVVIAENASAAAEGQVEPTIAVSADGLNIAAFGKGKKAAEISGWTKAGTDHTIKITASGVAEAAGETAGVLATAKITIKPIEMKAFTEIAGKVKKGEEPGWYTYTVPADDRYALDYTVGADQEKDSVLVEWYLRNDNGSKGNQVSTETYLTKNQKLYVRVDAKDTIADAGVDVTLKTPAALKTPDNTLTIEAGKTEVTKDVTEDDVRDGARYYVFGAPAYAKYEVALAIGESNTDIPDCKKYIYSKKGGDDWSSGRTLEKEEEILIKVTSAGKLTITQAAITELALNAPSNEITLAQNEEAVFAFQVFDDAYYDFAVSDAKGLTIIDDSGKIVYTAEDRCYFAAYLVEGERYVFTVLNSAAESAKLKVTAGKLTEVPVCLKMGENSVSVEKGRVSPVNFKAPEDYWYTVTCSAGSDVKGITKYELNSGDIFLRAGEDRLYSGVVAASDTEAVTAKITISKLSPAPASGETMACTLEPHTSCWYLYKADKAGKYQFTVPYGVNLYYCADGLSSNDERGLREIMLGVDANLYIRAENILDEKIEGENARITVTFAEAAKLEVGENPLTSESSGPIYLTFKAPVDGEYTFRTTSGSLTYYGETGWQSEVTGTSHVVRKDGVVYLTASSSNAAITVTKTDQEVQILDYVSVAAGEYQWITFTAAKDGEYTFYSTDQSGDPKAWFFKNKIVGNRADAKTLSAESNRAGYGNDDDGPTGDNNNNFEKKIRLSASETIYIAVGYYSLNSKISCYVCVK